MRIHPNEPSSTSTCEAEVERPWDPVEAVPNQYDPWIALFDLPDDLSSGIARIRDKDDHLELDVILRQDGSQALVDRLLLILRRDENRHEVVRRRHQ
jgi:hypothetical protein